MSLRTIPFGTIPLVRTLDGQILQGLRGEHRELLVLLAVPEHVRLLGLPVQSLQHEADLLVERGLALRVLPLDRGHQVLPPPHDHHPAAGARHRGVDVGARLEAAVGDAVDDRLGLGTLECKQF